ncbi:CRAL/TRIO domain-containing protein [Pseudohyphozyma bogoriensis]|nr:CRAL/TRIO domain-containing protein [Pseudohyphozyma bogoriensis]
MSSDAASVASSSTSSRRAPPPSRTQLPVAHPDPSSTSSAPAPKLSLTAEQSHKLAELIAHFNAPGFELPTSVADYKALHPVASGKRFGLFGSSTTPAPANQNDVVTRPLDDTEKCFWSTEQFQRCLRGSGWDYHAAVKRAQGTVVWRREFKPEHLDLKEVEEEAEIGSRITTVAPQYSPPTEPPVESLTLCIDLGSNRKEGKKPPPSLARIKQILEILQSHYCERLHKAYLINVPMVFWALWTAISPLMHPVTKEKVKFVNVSALEEVIPRAQLFAEFGGDVDFDYDVKIYLPALIEMCDERRAANFARWRQFGNGQCGLSEAVVRGFSPASSSASSLAEKEDEKNPRVLVDEAPVATATA